MHIRTLPRFHIEEERANSDCSRTYPCHPYTGITSLQHAFWRQEINIRLTFGLGSPAQLGIVGRSPWSNRSPPCGSNTQYERGRPVLMRRHVLIENADLAWLPLNVRVQQ